MHKYRFGPKLESLAGTIDPSRETNTVPRQITSTPMSSTYSESGATNNRGQLREHWKRVPESEQSSIRDSTTTSSYEPSMIVKELELTKIDEKPIAGLLPQVKEQAVHMKRLEEVLRQSRHGLVHELAQAHSTVDTNQMVMNRTLDEIDGLLDWLEDRIRAEAELHENDLAPIKLWNRKVGEMQYELKLLENGVQLMAADMGKNDKATAQLKQNAVDIERYMKTIIDIDNMSRPKQEEILVDVTESEKYALVADISTNVTRLNDVLQKLVPYLGRSHLLCSLLEEVKSQTRAVASTFVYQCPSCTMEHYIDRCCPTTVSTISSNDSILNTSQTTNSSRVTPNWDNVIKLSSWTTASNWTLSDNTIATEILSTGVTSSLSSYHPDSFLSGEGGSSKGIPSYSNASMMTCPEEANKAPSTMMITLASNSMNSLKSEQSAISTLAVDKTQSSEDIGNGLTVCGTSASDNSMSCSFSEAELIPIIRKISNNSAHKSEFTAAAKSLSLDSETATAIEIGLDKAVNKNKVASLDHTATAVEYVSDSSASEGSEEDLRTALKYESVLPLMEGSPSPNELMIALRKTASKCGVAIGDLLENECESTQISTASV